MLTFPYGEPGGRAASRRPPLGLHGGRVTVETAAPQQHDAFTHSPNFSVSSTSQQTTFSTGSCRTTWPPVSATSCFSSREDHFEAPVIKLVFIGGSVCFWKSDISTQANPRKQETRN